MEDLVLNWDLGTGGLLLLAAASIAFLLVLIMTFKIHAFLALMITSLLTAVAAGIPFNQLMAAIAFGFNPTLGSVMLLVALGAMLGRMIETSGGARVLTDKLIEWFGEQRAAMAVGVASLLMGFPIFFDAGLVVMLPIIYAVSRRLGGSLLTVAFPAALAFSSMHIFVPPHPGPVSASAILGADVGLVLLLGLVVALPVWYVVGVLFSKWVARRYDVAVPSILGGPSDDENEMESNPAFGKIIFLLVLPLVLILMNTGLNMFASTQEDPDAFKAEPVIALLRTLGETPIALLITVIVSMWLLGWGMGKAGTLIEKVADSALGPIASVVLVTGAGGMFGGVLRVTGIGDAIAESLNSIGMPVIVAAFLIAQIVRIAQGSATVALTTAASLMAGVVVDGGFNPVEVAAIVLATAAGSVGFSHVNDSGFWLVSKFFGMDVKTTLKTWTVAQGLMAIVGFIISFAIYLVGGLFG
ncbi:gluconate:H+ symporter, GntP family [Agrococcus baldri]|uniref:Gluconate:H+ symporter, GntP family n=1 Tax=Agrococcus baldri TaxID=153730 RepID=A0AA94HN60_9MICO|nr:GntP family permease [Agrococcus baldri]SFS14264.1 gluconate:H+ symporter, GntP family [Agrococcus baldri]